MSEASDTPRFRPVRFWDAAPEWCGYPSPLTPGRGCWSLLAGYVGDREYCKGCDCLIKGGKR